MSNSSERSVERVLDLLEELANWPYGVSLSDISRAVQLNKTTVYRLLNTLIDKGYVLKDPVSGKYRLSMRLFELGSQGRNGRHILTVALPYMERLARKTNKTICLAIPDGVDVVYLFKGGAYNIGARTPIYVGLRAPMYCTGTGKSIMASLSDEEIRTIWKHSSISKVADNTITSLPTFLEEIARIRVQGYAIDNVEHDIGFCGVAASIYDCNHYPCAAIGVSGSVKEISLEQLHTLAPEIKEIANEISQLLNN